MSWSNSNIIQGRGERICTYIKNISVFISLEVKFNAVTFDLSHIIRVVLSVTLHPREGPSNYFFMPDPIVFELN